MTRRFVVFAALTCLTLTGCGSSEDSPAETTASASPQPDIVGWWTRTTTCAEREKALKDAGLGRFAAEQAAGDGFIPGVSNVDQIKDPSEPCADAVPMKHGHFFTADGQFGSTDADNNQVDDDPYRIVDQDTIVIGTVTFDYTIEGDDLRLFPKLPACATSGCPDAQWAVAVSYNGLPWRRTAQ